MLSLPAGCWGHCPTCRLGSSLGLVVAMWGVAHAIHSPTTTAIWSRKFFEHFQRITINTASSRTTFGGNPSPTSHGLAVKAHGRGPASHASTVAPAIPWPVVASVTRPEIESTGVGVGVSAAVLIGAVVIVGANVGAVVDAGVVVLVRQYPLI